MKSLYNKIFWITLFSIAMGFMETAVVVYLREIYYPEGFEFPLVAIDASIALVEFLREAATIIMLVGIGILTGKDAAQKFAYFIYSFAIWDIFYYVFLKVLLNWPESLLTWDILFLIPVPWVGPVIAPCIISALMILLSVAIVYHSEKGSAASLNWKEWAMFIVGSIVTIISFVWDYFKYINEGNDARYIWTLSDKEGLLEDVANYVPVSFNWFIFLIGTIIITAGIGVYHFRMRKSISAG